MTFGSIRPVADIPVAAGHCKAVELIIKGQEQDLGGFSVRRLLPNAQRRMVGPWIFFDHIGPVTFSPGPGINVRPHPHINLATVTYLFAGQMLHRDSLGNCQTIDPGDINLMIAGRGIAHSERETIDQQHHPRTLHGLQLWLALPEADEETNPAFIHYPANLLPHTSVNDIPVRVMMGSAYGVTSPVKTFANTLYLEATIKAGQTLPLPTTAEERAVYVVSGELKALDDTLPAYTLTVFSTGQSGIQLTASADSRLVLIGGEPLGRRYIWWNFVSSQRDRIEQAKRAWADGKFPLIPGDEQEFIPLPE